MENQNPTNPNPQQVNEQFNRQFTQQPQVPNATAVLVLGIISIVGCFCYGLVGLVCGIIALILAGKGKAAYEANPGMYSIASYNNLKAGRVCAIIGTILSALCIVFFIIYIVFIGTVLSGLPWETMNNY